MTRKIKVLAEQAQAARGRVDSPFSASRQDLPWCRSRAPRSGLPRGNTAYIKGWLCSRFPIEPDRFLRGARLGFAKRLGPLNVKNLLQFAPRLPDRDASVSGQAATASVTLNHAQQSGS
jgi:hypothetical protein